MFQGSCPRCFILPILGLLVAAPASGSAFVRGAYYRLGDADPGAQSGNVGNDPTLDSFADLLHLGRRGLPAYSGDVSAFAADSRISMLFTNDPLVVGGGPMLADAYSRSSALDMSQQGFGMEGWVKLAPNSDSAGYGLIAYNGDPASNGFGFFRHGSAYVLRIGGFEKPLGPAPAGEWHHLAFVRELANNRYYYDGKLIGQSDTDPVPAVAAGTFQLGANLIGGQTDLFNGWIDEVRYFTYNPLAAGAFNPESFLVTPEPGMLVPPALAGLVLLRRRTCKGR